MSPPTTQSLLDTLANRFHQHPHRHKSIPWPDVLAKLQRNKSALNSLTAMEQSGGEPDVIGVDAKSGQFIFCDCSAESPVGRRSLCFDRKALDACKENKPKGCVSDLVAQMGVELLSEEGYRALQLLGDFDLKTSSWIATPPEVRALGGALFGDRRYGRVFVYHNGAESYYAARGFRGVVRV